MGKHIEVRSRLFKSLIGKKLIGIRYYCDDPHGSELQHRAKGYEDADNYLVLVFSDGDELSFYANGWPVVVTKCDTMAIDSFSILDEAIEALSIRFELFKLEIGQVSLFYTPNTQEFLALGVGENKKDRNFNLFLHFSEDAICEYRDVDEIMLAHLLNASGAEGLADLEIDLTQSDKVTS